MRIDPLSTLLSTCDPEDRNHDFDRVLVAVGEAIEHLLLSNPTRSSRPLLPTNAYAFCRCCNCETANSLPSFLTPPWEPGNNCAR